MVDALAHELEPGTANLPANEVCEHGKYKQFRLSDVAPAQVGFGLIGPDCRSFSLLGGQHGLPLLSIVYPTEAEAEVARQAITAALSTAIAVVTRAVD